MRTLITGINGFVGRHLTTFLQRERPQHHLFGTAIESDLLPGVDGWDLDLCDEENTRKLIQTVKPEVIFHLAAQAFVPRSFEYPWETLQNNIPRPVEPPGSMPVSGHQTTDRRHQLG